MVTQVKKRDNSLVDFNKDKIVIAIKKAMKISNGDVDKAQIIADGIYNKYKDKEEVSIYEIEKDVFMLLCKYEEEETARLYEGYRKIREYQRKQNSSDKSILDLVDSTNEEVIFENSNKNAFLNSTQRDLIAGEVSKDISLRKMIPPHLVQAHKTGAIKIHDLDYFLSPMTNCCLTNLGDMLDNGTCINKKMIRSPKSFQVACTVTSQIVAAISSNQFGGQSIDIKHLGKYLARSKQRYYNQLKDIITNKEELDKTVEQLTQKELQSGVQTIQYQINTLMTSNGQSPFLTIFLSVREDTPYREEVEQIIAEILRQRIEGLENEEGVKITPAFPKLVYELNEYNTKGKPAYWLTKIAAQCTASRMYPDYVSAKKMGEHYEGNCFSPMGK